MAFDKRNMKLMASVNMTKNESPLNFSELSMSTYAKKIPLQVKEKEDSSCNSHHVLDVLIVQSQPLGEVHDRGAASPIKMQKKMGLNVRRRRL